jgi:ADP-ribose pyrophosphatase YjhB (NUDIX family)
MSPSPDLPRFCARCAGALHEQVLEGKGASHLVCASCGRVTYQDPKLAALAVCPLDGDIVLLRRAAEPGRGKWVLPGGYVDRGETVQAAAVRETCEETGLRVALLGILDVYSYSGDPVAVAVYAADILSGELKALDEALEVRAFPPEDIPWGELASRSTREALRDYLRRYFPRVRVPRTTTP